MLNINYYISYIFILLVIIYLSSCLSSNKNNSNTQEKSSKTSQNKDFSHNNLVKKQYQKYEQFFDVKLTGNEDLELLKAMSEWLGTPYQYASHSKSGTDCSGFVYEIYKEVYDYTLNRSSHDMLLNVDTIPASELKFGDILFFISFETGEGIGHVGIYIADGKFIHASSGKNSGVIISSISESKHYKNRFYCGGRVPDL